MKQYMKWLMAIAALMLCGGAWATDIEITNVGKVVHASGGTVGMDAGSYPIAALRIAADETLGIAEGDMLLIKKIAIATQTNSPGSSHHLQLAGVDSAEKVTNDMAINSELVATYVFNEPVYAIVGASIQLKAKNSDGTDFGNFRCRVYDHQNAAQVTSLRAIVTSTNYASSNWGAMYRIVAEKVPSYAAGTLNAYISNTAQTLIPNATLADIDSGVLVGKINGNYVSANFKNTLTAPFNVTKEMDGDAISKVTMQFQVFESATMSKVVIAECTQSGSDVVIKTTKAAHTTVNGNYGSDASAWTGGGTVITSDNGNGYGVHELKFYKRFFAAKVGETKFGTLAEALTYAEEQATEDNPVTVTLLANAIEAIEIPTNVIVDPVTYQFTGAITGNGTIKLSCTGSTKSIGDWFGANTLTSFTGWIEIAGGRVKTTSSLESGVKVKVVDGGQLWIQASNWSNAVEISGNGWASENNDIAHAAIRLDGAAAATAVGVIGTITAVVKDDVTPTIGIHNSTAASISGTIVCPDGVKILTALNAGVLNITGSIKGSASDDTTSCSFEKIGGGELKIKTTAHATVKITSGKIRLWNGVIGEDVDFEIASGAKLTCYGWPTFAGDWSVKTDATITDLLDNTGNNPACVRTGSFTKKGSGSVTMMMYLGNGNGANNYKGSVTVEAGELILGKNSDFDSTATIAIKDGATLSVADGVTVSGAGATSAEEGAKIKGYGTSTFNCAISDDAVVEVGSNDTLTIGGSVSDCTIEKTGDGKLVFATGTTATDASLKLSAGKVEKTASTVFSSVTTEVENKLVLITSTFAELVNTPSLSNPTTTWGSDSNTSYFSKDVAAPTPMFLSDTSLEDIYNGEAKFTGKMKGTWVSAIQDATVVFKSAYVEGSNTLEIQCQMYDGNHSAASYTKVQNQTLYQIKTDEGKYFIFGVGSQGYYVTSKGDNRGPYIAYSSQTCTTPSGGDNPPTAYEVIKLQIDKTVEAEYNGTTYASITAAIAAAEANPGSGSVILRADTPTSIVIPSGVVLEIGNYTLSGLVRVLHGGWITENNAVKIDGFTTSFDVTYDDAYTLDYQQEPIAATSISGTASYFEGDDYNEMHGIYLKNKPKISNIPETFFTATDQLTMAVIGTMPAAHNTVFAHMGSAANNYNGIFLATGEKDNEVVVAYNKGATATVIATMTVPNAASARHLYIITKSDTIDKASFTVYLDGDEFTTQTFDKFIIKGGYQLGDTFSRTVTGFSAVANTDESSYVNVFRAYDRVISASEIARYKEVYQYTSIDGNYERTFETGNVDWSAESAWTRTDVDPHETVTYPTAGMVAATFEGDTTVTVNGTEANLYEKLTIAGTGTITFDKGEGADVKAITPVATQIMTPIVINEGSLDLAGGPTKVGEHGSVTFDFTSLTAKAVANDGGLMLKVTGITDADVDMTKFSVVKNEAESRLSVQVVRNSDDGCVYVKATVAPIDIYYVSGYFNAGESGDHPTLKLADGTTIDYDDVLACDTVVIRGTDNNHPGFSGTQFWSDSTSFRNIKVEKDVKLYAGETATFFEGVSVTVEDGVTLELSSYTSGGVNQLMTLADVAFGGTGTVKVASTMTAGAITGTAAVEIAEGATLTPSSIANTVKGSGTLQLVGAGMTSETAVHVPTISGLTADTWTGTFELKNWNGTINNPIFNPADYGHRNSSIVLDGYKGYVYYDDENTHDFKSIEIKGEGVVFNGSYSAGPAITFVADKIIGSGKIDCQVAGGNGTMKFVGDASAFTGAVTANTKYRVVFVGSSNTTIPDFTGKTIVIASDVSHGIASGTTWSADGGVVVAGTVTGEGTIIGPIKLAAANAKATVASVSGNVTSMVDGYTLVLNEVGSLKTYSLVQNGGTIPQVAIPEGTTEVSLAPGQSATFTGDAPTTITVKIANVAGGAAYDVTDYCTVTTENGTITTTLKDNETTQPAVTTMAAPTEEETDKVQFTITNPIPGLFYSVSSCDTPNGDFTSATGDQATSSEAKTVSIPMTFGENQKVKYYRVRVKATK